MRTLLFGFLVTSLFISCEKTNEKPETHTNTDNTTSVETLEAPVDKTLQLKEVSLNDVSDLLNKQNDTLYVTNFFATWCGPCKKEIPDFVAKIGETKESKVKFTFVNLDKKEDWNTLVNDFTLEKGINNHSILVDMTQLSPDFFQKNFKTWDGRSIPFTFMRKGSKTIETIGYMAKVELDEKIASFK